MLISKILIRRCLCLTDSLPRSLPFGRPRLPRTQLALYDVVGGDKDLTRMIVCGQLSARFVR